MADIGSPSSCPDVFPGDAARDAAVRPEELARDHWRAVLAVCLANGQSAADAEDVAQETFLRAVSKLHTLREADRARSWLLAIARRLCLDRHRRRRPVAGLPDDVPAPEPAYPADGDVRLERLHGAIRRLREDFREVITLYYLDGRSCRGVAQTLGIGEATVRQRLFRARLMLHEFLSEETP